MNNTINEGMTPVSGAGFSNDGYFSIGVEAFFEKTSPPGEANIAKYWVQVPNNLHILNINGGSIAAHPPEPKVKIFGAEVFKTDFLFRILATGDEENPLGYHPHPILSYILKTSWGPKNLVIPHVILTWPEHYPQMCIEFQQAGESSPSNMEMQITGDWE